MWKYWMLVFFISIPSNNIEGANIGEPNVGQWICKGRLHGDHIPHPEDCHAYFVCDRDSPKVVICHGNLHYDARQKVCNWPEAANCTLGNYPQYWESSPRPVVSTIFPETEGKNHEIYSTTDHSFKTNISTKKIRSIAIETKSKTTAAASTTNCNTTPNFKITTMKPKNSSIGSTDEDGRNVDPMKTYDPKKVQCLYNGVYFLPHPGQCQKYFICANHVMYLHSCGIDANWNYKAERCDYKQLAQCYFDENSSFKSTTKRRRVTQKTPPIKTTKNSETTSLLTTIIKDFIPECPTDRQRFIAHPTNCTQYFICIHGKAALTSCPDGLWWDEYDQWCGYPESSYCRAAN
ncbi:probable chitinase 10 [Condylostylus longicornis]|uniref:probable chitinase 10 n=1 Tax=Condylostylus longicornis TaxID=2530218 RepID=UPI00244D9C9F|nr:probable chitinase 10 [Condylostylus longicornis]